MATACRGATDALGIAEIASEIWLRGGLHATAETDTDFRLIAIIESTATNFHFLPVRWPELRSGRVVFASPIKGVYNEIPKS